MQDETDAKSEESSEKAENGGSTDTGVKPSTTTTSTSGTSDTMYELPQEKLEKPGQFVKEMCLSWVTIMIDNLAGDF